MITLRNAQMQVLSDSCDRQFEEEVTAGLHEFSPELCRIAGPEAVSRVVKEGIQRAERYGFTCCGPIEFFIDLMFKFGFHFDTDPQLPWARSVLLDNSLADELTRADRLYEAMNDYLDKVAGPNDQYAMEALRATCRMSPDVVLASKGDLETRVVNALAATYPQKREYVGWEVLHGLVRHSFDIAARHGITSDIAPALLSGLMFTFGHRVDSDPLYPWIARTLSDETIAAPNRRAEQLLEKSRVYFEQMLQNLQ